MSGTKDFKNLFGQSAAELAAAKGEKPQKTRPKYTSLRDDQLAELDDLARELMDKRINKRRRITSNTLIRVAIDALLAQGDRLEGDDEREIRDNYLRTLGVVADQEGPHQAREQESPRVELKEFKNS
ncbi:chromosome segregation ATPase [Streptomyces decoyicus]|uniref:chromosome segregation ATPase n=1 Tax=Streptomyces decoyicus TaxID=249567 RepID=UPI003625A2D5